MLEMEAVRFGGILEEKELRVEELRMSEAELEEDNGLLREYVGKMKRELEEAGRVIEGGGGRGGEVRELREENLGLQERLNEEIRGKNDAKNVHLVFKGKIKEFQEEKLCQIDVLSCEKEELRELLEKKEDELELCFKTSQYLLEENGSKWSRPQKMDFKGGSVASDQGFGGA